MRPMESHFSNQWNYAVSYLELCYDGQCLGTGSCFFWRANNCSYLVTNWHNLTGRNHLTMDVLSRTGGVPNQLRVTVFKRTTEPDVNGFFELTWTPIEVNLYEGELIKSRWLEHPLLGRHVDVAAIDVTEVCSGYEIKYVNEIESDAVLEVSASQDLFIIGFPFGMIANAPSPIWKRGTVALDPTFDPDGLPKMLVDTTSREGMSGSVVVARHIVVGRQYLKKDGTESPPILYGRHDTVVGIYSGRQYPDLEKAQLGIVWKRRLIEETVTGGKPAEVYF